MVEMKRKKYAILALLVGAIIILGVMHMGDNPDWTLPVSIRAQEIENLSVDIASQSISELTIRITGQDIPITIEPAAGVTFNITGDVNATIQGTASVSIDYATITVDVATIREKASAENKLEFEGGGTNVDAGSSKIETVYTNTLGETLYLEMITFAVYKTSSSAPDVSPLSVHLYFRIRDESNAIVAGFDANPCSSPLNFDPAIPILPNWKIEVVVENYSDTRIGAEWSILLRKG